MASIIKRSSAGLLTANEAEEFLEISSCALPPRDHAQHLKPISHPVHEHMTGRHQVPVAIRQKDIAANRYADASAPGVDWQELSDSEHFVQFYDGDAALIDSASQYFAATLKRNECGLIIATPSHWQGIEAQLKAAGIDTVAAMQCEQLVFLDAAEMLSKFMVDRWPDRQHFREVIGETVARLARQHTKLRAFGAMVALLWDDDNREAAIHLEELWNELGKTHIFSLFCAYPLHVPSGSGHDFFERIYGCHSCIIPMASYATLYATDDRLQEIARLQQKASTLEAEISHRREVEKSLLRRERELLDFFENAAESIHKVDAEGIIIWANKAELSLLGYEPHEYIDHHISEFHDDATIVEDIFQRLESGETLRGYEARLRSKSGAIKYVVINSNAFQEDGKFLYTHCFTRDITERKLAEDALRDSQMQQRLILDHAPVYLVRCDKNHHFRFVNRGYAERFHRSPEDFIGRSLAEMLGQDAYDSLIPYIEAVLSGQRVDFEREIFYTALGLRIMHCTYEPEFDAAGQVTGWFAVVTDITDRKRAQDDQALLAAVVQSSGDAIISKTIDGHILSWNTGAERLFGYEASEVLGRKITLIIPPERHDEEDMILGRLMCRERIEHYETMRMAKDGRLINISLTVSPLCDSAGRIIGASKIARDITEQKRIEKELQDAFEKARDANSAKSEFLANMSHELRTPLNAVIGLADLLQTPGLSPENRQEFTQTLQLSAQQLLQLINDLLDVSKLETQQMQLEKVPFSIEDIMTEIVTIYSVKALEQNIKLVVQSKLGVCANVIGDPLRFRQVLMNLVSNAVKFTEKGGVTVRITGHKNPADGKANIAIEVSDTGIGIAQENLDAIFNKFVQGDTSITRKYGGTGLGLSITKTLVELMGGMVAVQSELGKGSCFKVMIPFSRHEKKLALGTASPPADAAQIARQRRHILLVEDYPANILVATTMLDQLNCSYEVASTGHEALEKLKQQCFDLVLMDVQMPEMDGLTATRLLREWETETGKSRTPVVGVTAFALMGDKERCLESGMDDYITKPFQSETLEQKLASLNGLTPHA